MRILLAISALSLAAACTPPAQTTAEAPAPQPQPEAPAAPAADLGPYANTWDSDEFSRFNHTLRAAQPGRHVLALEARTGGGTETVAVYPADANGERVGGRILFVVATTGGTREAEEIDVPEAGVPAVVVVENASGRRAAGSYTLSLEPVAP